MLTQLMGNVVTVRLDSDRWLIGGVSIGGVLLLVGIFLLLLRYGCRAWLKAKKHRHFLQKKMDRLNTLFHQTAVGVAEIDPESGHFASVNARFCDILRVDAKSLEHQSFYDLLEPEDVLACKVMAQAMTLGQRPNYTRVQRIVLSNGQQVWTELWSSPLIADGSARGHNHIVLLQDVNDRQDLHVQLQEREADSSEMLRYMPVGLVVVGGLGQISFVNHQFELMTGWGQSDVPDETTLWRNLCVDQIQLAALLRVLNTGRCEAAPLGMVMPASEYLLRRRNGENLPVEVSARFLGDRILLTFVDLSSRKEAEAEIVRLGYYDTLTQLPNRRLLLDKLAEAVQHSARKGAGCGALLILDIDNFKSLNETRGHQIGDALLRLVAHRLTHCLSGKYTLARQGGDEFGLVLQELPGDRLVAGGRAEQVGAMVLEALRTPFVLAGQELRVTVSMGAAVFAGGGDTVEEVLKRADLALYKAKSNGRDTLQFFDPSMQQAVNERVEMDKDLRLALDRHEFDLYYQPQMEDGCVTGAEALLRWQHPVKGIVLPSVFVPAAEASGLILPLGEWVLYAACRQLAQWAKDPVLNQLSMAVNVSPRQFYQPNFVQQVQQALGVTGARADLLELELTEGMLLTDVDDTIEKMVQLKALGIIFSLDDFGTGYSSLSYLKRLPIDKLKIDQSFVREVLTSANDASIARTIVALGHSLGLRVIAEGVETPEQRDFLAASGCSLWQGFLFSPALPAPQFAQWVQQYSAGCVAEDAEGGQAPHLKHKEAMSYE